MTNYCNNCGKPWDGHTTACVTTVPVPDVGIKVTPSDLLASILHLQKRISELGRMELEHLIYELEQDERTA